MEKQSDNQTTFLEITKTTLDGSHVDELGIFTGPSNRYLVMTSMDGGKPSVNFHLLQFTRVLGYCCGQCHY